MKKQIMWIMKNSKVYIAGHRGLVGSAILKKLNEKGFSTLVLRRSKELDLRRQLDTERFFEQERPEYVFLAAAKVGGILANNTYKAQFIYDNMMIAANVIHAAYKYNVKKLLNLGSSCIYPKLPPQPMKEEYLLTGKLEPTNESYAIAKIGAIKLCRYYNEQYNTNFISAMPTNLYGPHDNFDLETSHVLPALIRKFHLAKLLEDGLYDEIIDDFAVSGSSLDIGNLRHGANSAQLIREYLSKFGISDRLLKLWGSGEPYREFLYIDDFVDACVFIMENLDYNTVGEFINIGSGKEIKIKDLAKVVMDIVGFNGKISYDGTKPDGTPRKLLDISRIKSFGWEPKTSLITGIKRTYDFYLQKVKKDMSNENSFDYIAAQFLR